MQRGMVLLFICVSMTVLGSKAVAQLGSQIRQEDSRLERRVVIKEKGIYLAEFLFRLAKQCDIGITMDERDDVSGAKVSVSVQDTPVGDVLNAVWSLISNREVHWTWRRSGEKGRYCYKLILLADRKSREERLRNYAQTAFEDYVDVMITMARMPMGERKKYKNRLVKALLEENDYWAKAYIDSPETWDAILLFADSVPPEKQKKILRGEQEALVAVSETSLENQSRLQRMWSFWNPAAGQPGGSNLAIPVPKTLRFYGTKGIGGYHALVNTIFLELSKGNSAESMSVISSNETGIRSIIRKLWLMPGETLESSYTELEVEDTHPAPPPQLDKSVVERFALEGISASSNLTQYSFASENRILELSQGTSIPVLTLLPNRQLDHGSPARQKVGEYLDKFKFDYANPIFKWRGKFLLANSANWFIGESPSIPYELVRLCLNSKSGVITLPQLTKLMSRIDGEQAEELAKTSPAIRSALIMRPLFAFYQKYPEVILPNGLALNAEQLAYIRSIPLYASDTLIQQNAITHLRLHSFEVTESYGKGLVIRPEVMLNGKWVSLGGFIQIPKVDTRK